MKISSDELNVLKNFAQINPNLVVQPGNVLKTMSESKSILARATVDNDFDQEFGIYDLGEFLNVLSMFQGDDSNMTISEDGNSMLITDPGVGSRATYFFSDPGFLSYPKKDINMTIDDIVFDLSEENLNNLRRAASVLGTTEVVVSGKEGESGLEIQVRNTKESTSNVYGVKIQDCTRPEEEFKMIFNIANFKFLPGDYRVEISDKLISRFENQTTPIEYWVALEKNSTIN